MKEEITWQTEYDRPELWLLNGIQEKEQMIFPHEYLDCIIHYQGGTPSRHLLNIEQYGTIIFKYLLIFVPFDDLDILDKYNVVRSHVSERVFPFAIDERGNFLCFDYRNVVGNPPIVCWNAIKHPKGVAQEVLVYVCKSFSELLHLLY